MNLRKMSIKQLDELSAKIAAQKSRRQREQAGAVKKQIMDTLRAAGLSVADVFGGGGGAAKPAGRKPGRPPKAAAPAPAPAAAAPAAAKGPKAAKPAKAAKKAAPKKRGRRGRKAAEKPGARAQKGVTYVNPADSKQRWSGYGKRPGWFLKAVAGGKTEADLRAK